MTTDNFSSHFLSALLPERKGVFMTVSLDLRAIKANARSLLRSGRARVLKLSALYLAIDLVLNLIDAAVSYMIYSSGGFTVLSFSFVSILVRLISIVLSAGFVRCCLGILRGEYMPYESLFDAFPFAGKVILLSNVEGLFIFLWAITGEFGIGAIGLLIMFMGIGQWIIGSKQQKTDDVDPFRMNVSRKRDIDTAAPSATQQEERNGEKSDENK